MYRIQSYYIVATKKFFVCYYLYAFSTTTFNVMQKCSFFFYFSNFFGNFWRLPENLYFRVEIEFHLLNKFRKKTQAGFLI